MDSHSSMQAYSSVAKVNIKVDISPLSVMKPDPQENFHLGYPDVGSDVELAKPTAIVFSVRQEEDSRWA